MVATPKPQAREKNEHAGDTPADREGHLLRARLMYLGLGPGLVPATAARRAARPVAAVSQTGSGTTAVTLDSAASAGEITSRAWSLVSGPAPLMELPSAGDSVAIDFAGQLAPEGLYVVRLTLTGPGGVGSKDTWIYWAGGMALASVGSAFPPPNASLQLSNPSANDVLADGSGSSNNLTATALTGEIKVDGSTVYGPGETNLSTTFDGGAYAVGQHAVSLTVTQGDGQTNTITWTFTVVDNGDATVSIAFP